MNDNSGRSYGCSDYRLEMMLIGLIKRLESPNLSESERKQLVSEIERLKADLKID